MNRFLRLLKIMIIKNNKNFNILAGCLKKTQFYRIVNLHTGAPPATGNPSLKIIFLVVSYLD